MVFENKSYSFKAEFPQLKSHSQWPAADFILRKLSQQGYEALIAGGAVRDLILGRIPGDLDIASNATPDQVEQLFHGQTVAVGKAFGVIRIIFKGQSIEVATYRQDREYKDGRRPESIIFTNRLEDAKRRDFTINALFYDAFSKTVHDDLNGKRDLDQKLLKCVGDAQLRFEEDQLRRLRLVRFVSQLGFQVETKTLEAVKKGVEGLQKVSAERVTEEIGKMWLGPYLPEAFKLLLETGMALQIDPAWKNDSDFKNIKTWNISRENKNEAWAHYFSFFFDENSIRHHFKFFRLSKEIENFVVTAHQAYQSIPQFLKARIGEQKLRASHKSFLCGFEFYIEKKCLPESKQELLNKLNLFKSQGPLPEPFIKARHIQDQFQGPELGQMLKKIYIEQLDQNWLTAEQAFQWLSNVRASSPKGQFSF